MKHEDVLEKVEIVIPQEEDGLEKVQSFDTAETFQQNAEALLIEATQILEKPDKDPNKANSLQNSLASLISLLSAGISSGVTDTSPITPAMLEELSQTIPQLTANPSIMLTPVEEKTEPESEWVESEARLSESVLWKLQEDYYSSQGISAWNQVPFFVTSSTFIADSYAEMIITFLKDHIDKINLAEPVYIVEMATGSGRFSQFLIRELINKKAHFARLKDVKLKYIMTDFTENNIEYWENHERFKPFVESGFLDFAVYRPEEYQFLQLRHAKVKVSNKTVKNPVIAIANYFFDTIRQDSFRIDEGVLKEGRINLWRNFNEKVSPADPVRVPQLSYSYNYHEVSDHFYEDEALNEILRFYRKEFYKASIIFPLGALNCVKNLLNMSNNNLVLISSDKGFTDMEYMIGHRDSEFAVHDGAFSYMVNYHAIRKYFETLGGASFFTSDKNLDLNTQVSILTPDRVTHFEELGYYFQEKMERCNPINYLYGIQSLIADDARDNTYMRLSGLLAFFRLNLCDPSSFCRFASMMFDSLDNISFVQRVDLLKVLDKTWDNYYHFGGEANVPFWIAQILFGLGMYEKSLLFFERTIAVNDPHEVVYYFMGKCYEHLNRLSEARQQFLITLEKNPDFAPARESLAELDIVLRERRSETIF